MISIGIKALGAAAVLLPLTQPAAAAESLEARVARLEAQQAQTAAKPVGHVLTESGANISFYGLVRVDAYKDFDYAMGNNTLGIGGVTSRSARASGWGSHAYQTRIGFRGAMPTSSGELKFNLESDFYGNNGGSLRIRHAYGEYSGFLIGQTWTNWSAYNASTMIDFDGLPGGAGYRALQVRYTMKASDAITASFSVEDDPLPWRNRPVLTAAFNYRQGANNYKLTAMSRELKTVSGGTASGWGLSISGMTKPWEGGNLQFAIAQGAGISSMLKGGSGIGQQDEGAGARSHYDLDRSGKAIGITALTMGLSHQINSQFELGAAIGHNRYDSFTGITPTAIKSLSGAMLTARYRPNERMTVGLEYIAFQREEVSGQKINADRLLAMAQFNF